MINKRVSFFIVFFLLLLYFIGCGGQKTQSPYLQEQAERELSKESRELNQKIIEETFTKKVTDYLIGPGDLLDIKVLEAKELDTEARVNARNIITFPLLGKVEVGGLTSQEVEKKLKELLTEKYMHDPHLVVYIKEYKSQRVAVLGSVNKPGSYEILGRGNLLDGLALAEGLSDKAGSVAYVSRRDSNGNENSVVINLNELLNQGKSGLNIPIYMGDVIYVPESGVFYVDGDVNHPGSFPLKGKVTVSKAVAVAGGVSKTGKASDVKLVRYRNEQREVIPINLDLIKQGEGVDLVLEDQDVVIVGKSIIKSFFNAIKLGLFFPPFSVGVQ